MDLSCIKCPSCELQTDDLEYLRKHASRKHGIKSEDLYLTLFCEGKRPLCGCGCKEELTRFHGMVLGYSTYRPGHQARVKNNWGHNQAVLEKSQQVRRDMFANGELTTWNSGLTKETDERVRQYGEACAETFTDEKRERYSKTMTENRLSKVVPDVTGSAHGRWNGGSSELQPLARSYLHKVWVYPKLLAAKFTCQACGSSDNLCVHHDQERFAPILQKGMSAITDDGTVERKMRVARWVADYHITEQVSGIVLCYDCHMQAHALD